MPFASSIRRWPGSLVFLLIAATIWLPCVHLLYKKDITQYRTATGMASVAKELIATWLDVWGDEASRAEELASMRRLNPEWDFMSRTFLVLSFANWALREPAQTDTAVEIIDAIITDTVERERQEGHTHFLLGYGKGGGWVVQPPRSIFVDGEIALMMAARRFLRDEGPWQTELASRTNTLVTRMQKSPVLCGESYPDECWIFCNSVALAAIRLAETLEPSGHTAFLTRWMDTARPRLIDPETGLLRSVFSVDGSPAPAGPVPEGSSIWLAAHMFEVVDPEFAQDQYDRSRKELGRTLLGFGFSREWAEGQEQPMDIDSGPVLPFVDASASASGLAVLGAAAFDDHPYLGQLMTSLECGGFPARSQGNLRYLASNAVGDAVLLYAMVEGPLWQRVLHRTRPNPTDQPGGAP